MPFGALALRVIYHEVSSPSRLFFMATILQFKVARGRLFEKVSLERCVIKMVVINII